MRVLVVDSFDSSHADRYVADQALASLRNNGNDVDQLQLYTPAFDSFMTEQEWRAYETNTPLQADATRDSAARVGNAEALLFLYPTTLFGLCPRTKAWMERVLVPGVAFTFNRRGKVRPGLTNIRRLGALTATPHPTSATRAARDLGRRMVLRTVRLNCAPTCRSTFLSLASGSPVGRTADQIERTFRNWTG